MVLTGEILIDVVVKVINIVEFVFEVVQVGRELSAGFEGQFGLVRDYGCLVDLLVFSFLCHLVYCVTF